MEGAPREGYRPESQWALWEEIWISPLSAASSQLSATSSSSILLAAFPPPSLPCFPSGLVLLLSFYFSPIFISLAALGLTWDTQDL